MGEEVLFCDLTSIFLRLGYVGDRGLKRAFYVEPCAHRLFGSEDRKRNVNITCTLGGLHGHCVQVKDPPVGFSLWKDPEQLPPGVWEQGEGVCTSGWGWLWTERLIRLVRCMFLFRTLFF